jgi:hypothetical protein
MNVGPSPKGGFEPELDVVAFNPTKRHLVHIKPSMDAHSWSEREKRYTAKFAAGSSSFPPCFPALLNYPRLNRSHCWCLPGQTDIRHSAVEEYC